jgi:hypothetical protein
MCHDRLGLDQVASGRCADERGGVLRVSSPQTAFLSVSDFSEYVKTMDRGAIDLLIDSWMGGLQAFNSLVFMTIIAASLFACTKWRLAGVIAGLPLVLLALFACYIAGAWSVAAQTPPTPATTQPALRDMTLMHPMVFYDAHGNPDACGPGCSEWIAAEGQIDNDSANRLQHLLRQLNGARLPIFFHSPGGRVISSMALGRLIRARQLTVSVGHTIPLGCNPDSPGEKSCEAKIRTGQPIEAELDPLIAMCNSACVYAVAGGAVRLIPPWVTLGIHDVGVDPSHQNWGAQAIKFAKESARARLQNYLHLMGIDGQLLYKAFAIPNATIGRLSRDDAARFGLDRREFGETVWRFIDKSGPTIIKGFFVRTGGEEPHYIDGFVNLSCGRRPSVRYVLAFGRELLPSDPSASSAQRPISIRLSDKRFDKQFNVYRQQHPKLYLRWSQLALTALDGVTDVATISLPGTEFGREGGLAGDITLTMDGFSAAYAKLQKACAQPG